jgi:hypothetical protein
VQGAFLFSYAAVWLFPHIDALPVIVLNVLLMICGGFGMPFPASILDSSQAVVLS